MRKSPMEFGALVARAQDDFRRDDPLIREVADQLFAEPFSRYAEKKSRSRRIIFVTTAVTTACAAAVIIIYILVAPAPLSINVDGATVQHPVGMFIEVQASEQKPLQFSDGSRVVLGASTGARIVETSDNGAAVLIERGTAAVEVVHREGTEWRFEVGPFTVRVTGTAFIVSWQPDEGFFSVTMDEGSVEVEGPILASTRTVVAGETLSAWTRTQKVVLVSNDDEVSPSPSKAEPVVTPPPRSVLPFDGLSPDTVPLTVEKGVASKAPVTTTSPYHVEDVVEGKNITDSDQRHSDTSPVSAEPSVASETVQYPEPLPSREAAPKASPLINKKIAPIVSVPEGVGPNDLLRQGAKERAAGDFDGAKHTYTMLRTGFPGTQAAAGAAFSLGRIAYDVDKDYDTAIDWFQTFLTENQGHGLKREAMGRLMESYVKAGRHTDAVATAERYLERYPDGPHATLARSIIDD